MPRIYSFWVKLYEWKKGVKNIDLATSSKEEYTKSWRIIPKFFLRGKSLVETCANPEDQCPQR